MLCSLYCDMEFHGLGSQIGPGTLFNTNPPQHDLFGAMMAGSATAATVLLERHDGIADHLLIACRSS